MVTATRRPEEWPAPPAEVDVATPSAFAREAQRVAGSSASNG